MFAVIASLALSLLGTLADGPSAVPPYSSLVRLQKEYLAMHSAKDPHLQATHIYLLNDAADRYAYQLNKAGGRFKEGAPDWKVLQQNTSARVEQANLYGASIFRCEFNGEWATASDGYNAYSSQWPKGPYAEEASWRGRLGFMLNGCFDAEGSEERRAPSFTITATS